MFNVLRQSLRIGVVTTSYPATPAEVSPHTRGRPEIDWAAWKDARPAARVCPTGAIAFADAGGRRRRHARPGASALSADSAPRSIRRSG